MSQFVHGVVKQQNSHGAQSIPGNRDLGSSSQDLNSVNDVLDKQVQSMKA